MFAENTQYEILTPFGWNDFRGVTKIENKVVYEITLKNEKKVSATADHHFFINEQKIRLSNIRIGDFLDTKEGPIEVISIMELPATDVYDIVEVDNEKHQFFVSDCFISKNCDELAFVEPSIATAFWSSISPTLATGGKTIITSTPNSDEDLFATLWKEANYKFDEYGNEKEVGTNGFKPFKALWHQHPDRDEAWKEKELAKIGHIKFSIEYDCQFLVYNETLINAVKLGELEGIDPILKMGQVRWYKKPKRNRIYCVALDPAMGTGGNSSAIQVLELPTMTQVAEWHHNETPVEEQIIILKEICNYIKQCRGGDANNIYWTVENNNLGEATLVVIKHMGEENIPGLFLSEPHRKGHVRKFRKGFNTTHMTKIEACSQLKSYIEYNKLTIHSKPLISELKSYLASGYSFKAKIGAEDDLVSAMLIIVRMIKMLGDWHTDIYEKIGGDLHDVDVDYEAPLPIRIGRGY